LHRVRVAEIETMDSEVRYAKRDDLYVAYEVQGDGPPDLLAFQQGSNVWVDRDGEPHWDRFDERLASFSRLIRYDPAGIGLSDPLASGARPSLDNWMRDALAVLDAVGSTQVALFGVSTGALVAILLAATHPARVSHLVLVHAFARLVRDDDYSVGIPKHVFERFVDSVTDPSYAGESIDDLGLSAPSLVGDRDFRAWWKRAGERSASPSIARAMDTVAMESDLRAVLPSISAPTLVLHRVDNRFLRVEFSHYLAEHIGDARLVELPGDDHMAFAGETDEMLGEIEEFLTGVRSATTAQRQLATILFTDIVDSTKLAVATGDRRWRDVLDDHDRMSERQVRRFGGRRVKTTGDGMLATFDSPASAIRSGVALCDGACQLGLKVRVGLHTGEVELRGGDVAGIAVHVAARVQAAASPGEVWVSRTVADLVAGSEIRFDDRGEHELKGVPGAWQLFAVERD
jgi:class 3 adenylate cyclase